MSGFSPALKKEIFERLIRSDSLTISLYQDDPNEKENSEIKGDTYRKQSVTLSEFEDDKCFNTNQIDFPVVSQSWGFVTHYGIKRQDGTLLFSGRLDSAVNLSRFSQLRIFPGQLVVGVNG